jgi:hypothetical protein
MTDTAVDVKGDFVYKHYLLEVALVVINFTSHESGNASHFGHLVTLTSWHS